MSERLTEKVSKNMYAISYTRTNEMEVHTKLGQLEDIEERIGCPLEAFLQVFRKGIFVKSDCTKRKIEYWHPQEIKVIDAGFQWDICKINSTSNKYVGCFNYKKTWSIRKEDLE